MCRSNAPWALAERMRALERENAEQQDRLRLIEAALIEGATAAECQVVDRRGIRTPLTG
jgi:hypothetical protein